MSEELEFDSTPSESTQKLFSEYEQEIISAGNIAGLAGMYRSAYDDVELKQRELAVVQSRKDQLATALYDALVTGGLEKITTEDGSFAPHLEANVSIIPGKEEQVFAALEEVGLGNVIKRKVEWQTLNKLNRDGELKDIVGQENLFSSWERKKIRIRRATGTF